MLQRRSGLGVHFAIPFYLGSPKLDIGGWPSEQGAVMPMPETSMRKDNGFVSRENNIRFSWKVSDMEAEPESPGK
jgi:hypothetical protein